MTVIGFSLNRLVSSKEEIETYCTLNNLGKPVIFYGKEHLGNLISFSQKNDILVVNHLLELQIDKININQMITENQLELRLITNNLIVNKCMSTVDKIRYYTLLGCPHVINV
jgi:hypothetical protein